jgi:hypothetical protein
VLSQRARKRIEEAFGWIKTIAGQARTRLRGLERVAVPRALFAEILRRIDGLRPRPPPLPV